MDILARFHSRRRRMVSLAEPMSFLPSNSANELNACSLSSLHRAHMGMKFGSPRGTKVCVHWSSQLD